MAHVEHSIVIVTVTGVTTPARGSSAAEKSLVLLLPLSLPPLKSHRLSQGHCSSTQNSSSELSAKSITRSCMLLNSLCWGRKTNIREIHVQKGTKQEFGCPHPVTEVPQTLQLRQTLPRLGCLYSQQGSQLPYLPWQLPYLPFVSLGAVSPAAVHDLDAVERSQDEQGSGDANSHRNQHPRHVSCLEGQRSRATLPKPSSHSHLHQHRTAMHPCCGFLKVHWVGAPITCLHG